VEALNLRARRSRRGEEPPVHLRARYADDGSGPVADGGQRHLAPGRP
jgi:hypothetical protein